MAKRIKDVNLGRSEYQPPMLIALGDAQEGWGIACKSGSNATGVCQAGTIVSGSGQCTSGGLATNNCNAGSDVRVQLSPLQQSTSDNKTRFGS